MDMSKLVSRDRRGVTIAAGSIAGLLALSGCGAAAGAFGGPKDSVAVITVTPDGTGTGSKAPAHSPIVVAVKDGHLTDVSVVGPKGQLPGSRDVNETVWTSNQKSLEFGAIYQVKAQAVDDNGLPVELSRTVTTVKPKDTIWADFDYFQKDETVGVGMIVRIVFDQPVKNRKAVEQRLILKSSKPVVGAWGWDTNNQAVDFRPKTFWPAKTKVKVSANLHGVEAKKGVFFDKDLKTAFKTGDSIVSTVDSASHTMTVVKNGKKIRSIPVTSGKSGFETRSGIKPIMSKEGTVIMDAATGGTSRNSSEYYRLTVHYSMRMTPSGEFLHAAPWSQGSQCYANVSHGCVGMSTSNAIWMYDMTRIGDVVIVKNTGRTQNLGNGITDWNITWKNWLKRSKAGVQNVGPAAATPATV